MKTTKEKKTREKKKNEKVDVTFFNSIRFRFRVAFLIPVLCIIILGTASYKQASNALIASYKTSVSQTVNAMQQYLSLEILAEQNYVKTYVSDATLSKYMTGVMGESLQASTNEEYMKAFKNRMALNKNVSAIYFLMDQDMSIYVETVHLPEDAFSTYMSCEQGKQVGDNKYDWFLYGRNPAADEVLGVSAQPYAVRIAKRLDTRKAIMIVDLSVDSVRNAMKSLDPSENGHVVLITSDGVEFYADENYAPEAPLIYGTDFYNNAKASEATGGNEMITLDGKTYLFVYGKLETADAMVATLIPQTHIVAQSEEIKTLSVVLTLIAVVAAALIGTIMSRQIAGTIQYILRQLRKVAKGDLTVHLTAKRRDELGLLCEGVNETVYNVKGLISSVNEVSAQLNEAASYVNEASGTFVETSHDIQNVVSELEIGVNKLDTGSNHCMDQMDSLSGKITNVSVNTDEIGQLTNAAGQTITSGIASVQGLTESAMSTARITNSVIGAIAELEEKSQSIGKIISEINDIAEQTNLLSLNASIEAARAGEAGRGFAVVAEEIRKLSDQCQSSAGKIYEIVDEIVDKTREAVIIAREAEDVVHSQTGAVELTTSSFKMIDEQVGSLIRALQTISSNVQEMSASRNETIEAIEGISAVSAETAACSTSVYDTAGTQLAAVKDLEAASAQLRTRSDQLVEILGMFQV